MQSLNLISPKALMCLSAGLSSTPCISSSYNRLSEAWSLQLTILPEVHIQRKGPGVPAAQSGLAGARGSAQQHSKPQSQIPFLPQTEAEHVHTWGLIATAQVQMESWTPRCRPLKTNCNATGKDLRQETQTILKGQQTFPVGNTQQRYCAKLTVPQHFPLLFSQAFHYKLFCTLKINYQPRLHENPSYSMFSSMHAIIKSLFF